MWCSGQRKNAPSLKVSLLCLNVRIFGDMNGVKIGSGSEVLHYMQYGFGL